jgi:Glycosyl transferase family 2
MDEKMESYGELISTGERTTVASAIVETTGCQSGRIDELSFVIPVYNEAAAILETPDEVAMVLPKCDVNAFEIVVVDDGSSDGSAELMTGLAHVRIVRGVSTI